MTNLADFALRSRFPQPLKDAVKAGVESVGEATAKMRAIPGFVIIGGQRCGTTSLYQYLIECDSIGAASTKEVHYFDVNYSRGYDWYQGHFPTRAYLRHVARKTGVRAITGEASPYYLFHPRAHLRAAETLPDARLIVMLREPVSRLISQFHHETSLGWESLPLEAALKAEPERLAGEEERIMADSRYNSVSHQHHSYFARGIYVDQLERWFARYPREQIMVLEAGDFFRDTTGWLDRVLTFLGQPGIDRQVFETHNAQRYGSDDGTSRESLAEAYAPHNERLWTLLGRDLGWNDRLAGRSRGSGA